MTPKLPRRSHQGFTLFEMIITVAVMAILISISTPSIFEFMRQRDRQQEEIAQNEVIKAMQAYLADKGVLPDDTVVTGTDAWYNLLAGYTSLSANEIANDTWGRPRTYLRYVSTSRKLFGNPVNIYYATLHSKGINGNAENTYLNSSNASITIDGLAVNGTDFNAAAAGGTSWWRNRSTENDKIQVFSTLRAGGDDLMTRFTNYSETLDRYSVTVDRLDRVTQALETYARSGYAERVSFCNSAARTPALCDNSVPEQTIYYPRSTPISGGNDAGSVQYNKTTVLVANAQADTNRRNGMKDLMNELGLPAEYCCSALTNASDGEPAPFYYFSNPRPRTSTACGTRPAGADAKLPARLTTKNNADATLDRTCG